MARRNDNKKLLTLYTTKTIQYDVEYKHLGRWHHHETVKKEYQAYPIIDLLSKEPFYNDKIIRIVKVDSIKKEIYKK